MAVQKQSLPSIASIISVLSVVFYCVGFIRVELEMNKQTERISALENTVEAKPKSKDADVKISSNAPETPKIHRHIRQADSSKNASGAKSTAEVVLQMNKLLSSGRLYLCQSKGDTCSVGPPGPPGSPGPRGHKGNRGRRGQKGRAGEKGDRGIVGSPGMSGKQGIVGPVGIKGETGIKGEKGDVGPPGIPGAKGASISSPTVVVVSPVVLTVNEGGSASFQCLANGNPEPTVAWSKLENQSEIIQSAVSRVKLQLTSVTGNDSGLYQCTATNILGESRELVQLIVNVRPRIYLHPGPYHVIEGTNATLPICHVTGYPAPVVTWRKSSGQLPQGKAQYNDGVLQIYGVRKDDSDAYFCSAVNPLGNDEKKTLLVVISLPAFTVKPPEKVSVGIGETLTLKCGATGDPQPVISWKRQGAALPVGRSHTTNDMLIIRDLKEEDAGNYICVATSAGVFHIETISDVEVLPSGTDCSDLLKSGHTQSGVYAVNPDGRGYFNVYCDMRTDGGGWIVFQRRQDGSVDFYRGWNDYRSGFGQLTAEFWLGNDKIHRLTASRPSALRVELEDWSGSKAYAKYDKFNISDEQALYRLKVGSYSGTAGDSLAYHNNMAFTTKDRDSDKYDTNCAVQFTGAWWYNNCQNSNLNGRYLGEKRDSQGALWSGFRSSLSLKFTEMKMRPSS